MGVKFPGPTKRCVVAYTEPQQSAATAATVIPSKVDGILVVSYVVAGGRAGLSAAFVNLKPNEGVIILCSFSQARGKT